MNKSNRTFRSNRQTSQAKKSNKYMSSIPREIEEQLRAANLYHFINKNLCSFDYNKPKEYKDQQHIGVSADDISKDVDPSSAEIVIEVYENEKHRPFFKGWGSIVGVHLSAYTDRNPFTDDSGRKSISGRLGDVIPINGFKWSNEWSVVVDKSITDNQGYQYARNWRLLANSRKVQKCEGRLTSVRRRKWTRTMIIDTSLPSKSLPFELSIRIKKVIMKSGSYPNSYVETYFDGILSDTTLTGEPNWNSILVKPLIKLDPTLKISFSFFTKKYNNSEFGTCRGSAEIFLSRLCESLDQGAIEMELPLLLNGSNYGTLISLSLELKETKLFSILPSVPLISNELNYSLTKTLPESFKQIISEIDINGRGLVDLIIKILLNYPEWFTDSDIIDIFEDLQLLQTPANNNNNSRLMDNIQRMNNAIIYPYSKFCYCKHVVVQSFAVHDDDDIVVRKSDSTIVFGKEIISNITKDKKYKMINQSISFSQPSGSSLYELSIEQQLTNDIIIGNTNLELLSPTISPMKQNRLFDKNYELVINTSESCYAILVPSYYDYVMMLKEIAKMRQAVHAGQCSSTFFSSKGKFRCYDNLFQTQESETNKTSNLNNNIKNQNNTISGRPQILNWVDVMIVFDGEKECITIRDDVILGELDLNMSNRNSSKMSTKVLSVIEQVTAEDSIIKLTGKSNLTLSYEEILSVDVGNSSHFNKSYILDLTILSATSFHLKSSYTNCVVEINSADGQHFQTSKDSVKKPSVMAGLPTTVTFQNAEAHFFLPNSLSTESHVFNTYNIDQFIHITFHTDDAAALSSSRDISSTYYFNQSQFMPTQLSPLVTTPPINTKESAPPLKISSTLKSLLGSSSTTTTVQQPPPVSSSSNVTHGSPVCTRLPLNLSSLKSVEKYFLNQDIVEQSLLRHLETENRDLIFRNCYAPYELTLRVLSIDSFSLFNNHSSSSENDATNNNFDNNTSNTNNSSSELYFMTYLADHNGDPIVSKSISFTIDKNKIEYLNKSRSIKVTSNPVWNEEVTISTVKHADDLSVAKYLVIEIWMKNSLKFDKCVGEVMLPLVSACDINSELFAQDDRGVPIRKYAIQPCKSMKSKYIPKKVEDRISVGILTTELSVSEIRNVLSYDLNFDKDKINLKLGLSLRPIVTMDCAWPARILSDTKNGFEDEVYHLFFAQDGIYIQTIQELTKYSEKIKLFMECFESIQTEDKSLFILLPYNQINDQEIFILTENMISINFMFKRKNKNNNDMLNEREFSQEFVIGPCLAFELFGIIINRIELSKTRKSILSLMNKNNPSNVELDSVVKDIQYDLYVTQAILNDLTTHEAISNLENRNNFLLNDLETISSSVSDSKDSDELITSHHNKTSPLQPSDQNRFDRRESIAQQINLLSNSILYFYDSNHQHIVMLYRIFIIRKAYLQLYFWFFMQYSPYFQKKKERGELREYSADYIQYLAHNANEILLNDLIDVRQDGSENNKKDDTADSLVPRLEEIMSLLYKDARSIILYNYYKSIDSNSRSNVMEHSFNAINKSKLDLNEQLSKLIYDQFLMIIQYVTSIITDTPFGSEMKNNENKNVLVRSSSISSTASDDENINRNDSRLSRNSISSIISAETKDLKKVDKEKIKPKPLLNPQKKRDLICFIITQDNLFEQYLNPLLISADFKFTARPLLSRCVDFDELVLRFSTLLNENILMWNSRTLQHFIRNKEQVGDINVFSPWDVVTITETETRGSIQQSKNLYISNIPETIQQQLNLQIGLKKVSPSESDLDLESLQRVTVLNYYICTAIAKAYLGLASEYEKIMIAKVAEFNRLKSEIESKQNNGTKKHISLRSSMMRLTMSHNATDSSVGQSFIVIEFNFTGFILSIINDCTRINNQHIPESITSFIENDDKKVFKTNDKNDNITNNNENIYSFFSNSCNAFSSVALNALNELSNIIFFSYELKQYFLSGFQSDVSPIKMRNFWGSSQQTLSSKLPSTSINKKQHHSTMELITATLLEFFSFVMSHLFSTELLKLLDICIQKIVLRYLIFLRDLYLELPKHIIAQSNISSLDGNSSRRSYQMGSVNNTSPVIQNGASALNQLLSENQIKQMKRDLTSMMKCFTSIATKITPNANNNHDNKVTGENVDNDSHSDEEVESPDHAPDEEEDTMNQSEAYTITSLSLVKMLSDVLLGVVTGEIIDKSTIEDIVYTEFYVSPPSFQTDTIQYDIALESFLGLSFSLNHESMLPTASQESHINDDIDHDNDHDHRNEGRQEREYSRASRLSVAFLSNPRKLNVCSVQFSDFSCVGLIKSRFCAVRLFMDNIQKETAIRRGASKVIWDDSITFQNIDSIDNKLVIVEIVEIRPFKVL
eukprot:gene7541-10275_t